MTDSTLSTRTRAIELAIGSSAAYGGLNPPALVSAAREIEDYLTGNEDAATTPENAAECCSAPNAIAQAAAAAHDAIANLAAAAAFG